jgi:hypothetical protein
MEEQDEPSVWLLVVAFLAVVGGVSLVALIVWLLFV